MGPTYTFRTKPLGGRWNVLAGHGVVQVSSWHRHMRITAFVGSDSRAAIAAGIKACRASILGIK